MSIPTNTKRVAFLLPDLRAGGAERVCVNLANEFSRRGFLVDFVLMRNVGELRSEVPEAARIVELSVKRERYVFLPLLRYLHKVRPIAMIACMWPFTTIAIAANKLSGSRTRVVASEHTTWSASERGVSGSGSLVLKWSMRLFFPLADGIVAVSDGAADDLATVAGIDRARITRIYNPIVGGVRAVYASPPRKISSWSDGAHRKVIAVGTLKAIKDYGNLLSAFALLCDKVDSKLLILGEGPERAALEAQVAELGLVEKVFLPGFVPNPGEYVSLADLQVLSSRGEGFGNVIVEALDVGTPVVSTDCRSGPREILANGRYGRLVPVNDSIALADAMEASLLGSHSPDLLKARAAEFSVAKAADAYLDLLVPNWRRGEVVE